ncbi:MAG: signal peptide peptidase SppA [Dasania sp.]|jgi:signal peptide peptidase SppA
MLKKIKKTIQKYLPASDKEIIPVLRLEGVIGSVKSLGKKGISFEALKKGIDEAFDDENVNVVAIVINSPGGSPVQSSLIFKYLTALKQQKKKKIMVFVEDVAASGGYYIACCADEIYADHHSIVGSIGVVSGGFGFTGAIEKLGVERRIYTSGQSKAMLDPFMPENPDHVAHLKSVQEEVHKGFKDVVTKSRFEKLQDAEENEIFSGKFWTGGTALTLGLIDGIDSLHDKMTALYGEDFKLVPIETDKKGFLEKYAGIQAETLTSEIRYSIQDLLSTKL